MLVQEIGVLFAKSVVCLIMLDIPVIPAQQIRVGQRSITANLWPLTVHWFMIIVTDDFSKKSFFFINIIFIF